MEEFTHPGFVAAASSAIRVLGSSGTADGDEVPPSPAAQRAAGWTLGNSAFANRKSQNPCIRRLAMPLAGLALTGFCGDKSHSGSEKVRHPGSSTQPNAPFPDPCGSGAVMRSYGRLLGLEPKGGLSSDIAPSHRLLHRPVQDLTPSRRTEFSGQKLLAFSSHVFSIFP